MHSLVLYTLTYAWQNAQISIIISGSRLIDGLKQIIFCLTWVPSMRRTYFQILGIKFGIFLSQKCYTI